MPSLTITIGPDGPIVDVGIAISGPRQTAMRAAGINVPMPVMTRALLDTGASCTAIDSTVITKLGLQPTGTTLLHTPSTGTVPKICNQFDVAIGIWMNPDIHVPGLLIPVLEADFSQQSIDALIGRDILNLSTMIYNGQAKTVTLTF